MPSDKAHQHVAQHLRFCSVVSSIASKQAGMMSGSLCLCAKASSVR